MNKVVIVIENGILSCVITDQSELNYVVIDHDPKGDEPLIFSGICTPEKVATGKLSDYFKGNEYPNIQIHDKLRELDF